MSPNSNLDRRGAGDRLKALGFQLDGAVNFLWIVIHHSAGKDGSTYDWPGIKKYHMSHRFNGEIITKERYDQLKREKAPGKLELPWTDIGYGAGIELVDGKYRISVGRTLTKIGAHAEGFNQQSLGICHVGNFDQAKPPEAIWNVSLPLVMDFMRWFAIPAKNVIGHYEVYPRLGQSIKKSCPGVKWIMEEFREAINARLEAAVA